jgi:hypothetical protein
MCFTLLSMFLLSITYSQTITSSQQNDIDSVKNTIVESYIEAIFIKADTNLVKKGWHPECDISAIRNGNLMKVKTQYLIDRLKEESKPIAPDVKYKFTEVKVTGYAAIAIIEIYIGNRHTYTDYIGLYKINGEWKIISKIFYTNPKN